MVGAALTLWAMFSLWVVAPSIGVPPAVGRTAAGLVSAELVALLSYSYGCDSGRCDAFGQAAGSVARIDLPILSAVFVALLLLLRRRLTG